MQRLPQIFLRYALLVFLVSIGCKESPTDPGTNNTTCTITSYPVGGDVGDTLVIYGVHMSGVLSNTRVAISGTTVPVVSANKDSIVFVVAAGVKSGPITVTVNGLVCTSPQSFFLGYGSTLIIKSISSTSAMVGDTIHLTGKNLPTELFNTQIYLDSTKASIVTLSKGEIIFVVPPIALGAKQIRIVSNGSLISQTLILVIVQYEAEQILAAGFLDEQIGSIDSARIDIKVRDSAFDAVRVFVDNVEQVVLKIEYSRQDSVMSLFIRCTNVGTIRVSVLKNSLTHNIRNPLFIVLRAPVKCSNVVYYWQQDSVFVYALDLTKYYKTDGQGHIQYTSQLLVNGVGVPNISIVYRASQNCSVIFFTPLAEVSSGTLEILVPTVGTITASHATVFSRLPKDVGYDVSCAFLGVQIIRDIQKMVADPNSSTTTKYSDTSEVNYLLPGTKWLNHTWNGDTAVFTKGWKSESVPNGEGHSNSSSFQSLTCILDTAAHTLSIRISDATTTDYLWSINTKTYNSSNSKLSIVWSFTNVPYIVVGSTIQAELNTTELLSKATLQYSFSDYTWVRQGNNEGLSTSRTCTSYGISSILSDAKLVLSLKR